MLSSVLGGQISPGGWAVSGGEVLDRVLVQNGNAQVQLFLVIAGKGMLRADTGTLV